MATSRKIVRVFLASPGDLEDERRAVKDVVAEINTLWADWLGYHVELVAWEEMVSRYGRPQGSINRDLERCELFIGMMWKKWGTPPDLTGQYTSGFEEEFEISVSNREKFNKPEISMYFKRVNKDQLQDPGPELQKVLSFKNKIISEKIILFEEFSETAEFINRLRRGLTRYLQDLQKEETSTLQQGSQAAPNEDKEIPSRISVSPSPDESLIASQGLEFLSEFGAVIGESKDKDGLQPEQVARFRLLANLLRTTGNDDGYCGVHDLNLLFLKKDNISFGRPEIDELLESGLHHFSAENTPIWHWYQLAHRGEELLYLHTISGSSAKRIGAFSAMRLLREEIRNDQPIKNAYVGFWLELEAAPALKVAALDYLSICGTSHDLALIKKELDKNDYQTSNAAANAIIKINLKSGRERAVQSLYEIQSESVSEDLIREIFENPSAISTHLLVEGTRHKSASVRLMASRILRGRNALTPDITDLLLSDSDRDVRCEALLSQLATGREISDDDAKQILEKSSPPRGIGFLSSQDSTLDDCLSRVRIAKAQQLSVRELKSIYHSSSDIFSGEARFTLIERRFSEYSEEIRRNIDDEYRGYFSDYLSGLRQRFNDDHDLLRIATTVVDQTRKKFARKALDILCKRASGEDLARVRRVLKSGFVDYSENDAEYLGKVGEWDDVDLIVQILSAHIGRPRGLLSTDVNSKTFETAAAAIYRIGKSRLSDLLEMEAPNRLLSHIIVVATDKGFNDLADETILRLCNSKHETIRKSTALKAVKVFSRARLHGILAAYHSKTDLRYYNVVHWLDFGISIPRAKAIAAVMSLLDNWK